MVLFNSRGSKERDGNGLDPAPSCFLPRKDLWGPKACSSLRPMPHTERTLSEPSVPSLRAEQAQFNLSWLPRMQGASATASDLQTPPRLLSTRSEERGPSSPGQRLIGCNLPGSLCYREPHEQTLDQAILTEENVPLFSQFTSSPELRSPESPIQPRVGRIL